MSISFNYLGNCGRLGNQMFQYASLKGISSNNNYDFFIPEKDSFGETDLKVRNSDNNIYDVFGLNNTNNIGRTNFIQFREKNLNFDEKLFNSCPDEIDLIGYFQSPKYFDHIKDEIKKDFTFSNQILDECKNFLNSVSLNSEVISLHVRRGDYLQLESYHPIQSIEYYINSLEDLPKHIPVIIFTDDVYWCNQQSFFNQDRFLISENNTSEFDMCLMTQCNYHIISNSSFSWWGSWLSDSKLTIAPKKWFGSSYDDQNCKIEDRILMDWILL